MTAQKTTELRNPTLRDVARHAGVSHMTVSRVINGTGGVGSETRASVQASIAALRFSPNLAARALVGARQVKIALLHRFPNPGSLGEFFIHLLRAATQAHASLVIREVAGSHMDREVVDELVADGVQGAILAPPLGDDAALVALLKAARMTVVATGSTHARQDIPSVGIDEREAARAMTGHLLSLGHRRIGFVQGRPSHASTRLRLDGYRDALAGAGVPFDDALVAQGNYDYQSGMTAADGLLGLALPPTAIFASNDDMAAAALSVAHRRGIDVPTRLSVVGFDDSPLATTIWPTLTTVRQPSEQITQTAFRLVLAGPGSERTEAPGDVVLDHAIVRRESDGPPG